MAAVDPVTVVEFLREEIARKTGQPARNIDVATLVAIAFAENMGRATGSEIPTDRSNSEGNEPEGSVDRGMWMINSYWHPTVTDECAYDWRCATRYTVDSLVRWDRTDQTSRFGAWTAFKVGNHVTHLPLAWMAVRVADRRADISKLNAAVFDLGEKIQALNTQLEQQSAQTAIATEKIAVARALAEQTVTALA
jgi:hypothetical protein